MVQVNRNPSGEWLKMTHDSDGVHCFFNLLFWQENIPFHAAAEVYPVKNIDRPRNGKVPKMQHTQCKI